MVLWGLSISGSRAGGPHRGLRPELSCAVPGRIGSWTKPSYDSFAPFRLQSCQPFNIGESNVFQHASNARCVRFPIDSRIMDGIVFWPTDESVNLESCE